MRSRRLIAASAAALLAACGGETQGSPVPPVTPAPPLPPATVATFSVTAVPAARTLVVSPVAPVPGRSALRVSSALGAPGWELVPVVQDGRPHQGPADTAELVTLSVAVIPDGCGPGVPAFEGIVELNSFYAAHRLVEPYVEITGLSPMGHEACNSAASPDPELGNDLGLFRYADLAAGSAASGATAAWRFRLPDMLPFTFTGRVVAKVEDGQAPVTRAAPAGGAYGAEGQSVTLSCEDGASGCAATWWSLDGSAPSRPYVGPIPVFSTAELCFASVDAAGNVEAPRCERYEVDTVRSAARDATLGAPRCATVGSACDTGPALVLGRAGVGPEPGQPNTLGGACADGTYGTFHYHGSIDALRVSTLDGGPLASGAQVRIDATIWAGTTWANDALDLYAAADAGAPAWALLATLRPTKAGAQVLSANAILGAGTLQALRAQLRPAAATPGTCVAGAYNDRDDLAFATEPAAADPNPPTVSLVAPAEGAVVSGVAALAAEATDDVAVVKVEFYAGEALVAAANFPPWTATWDTTALAPGPYALEARAYDVLGNVGRSAVANVEVADLVPPAVALTVPAAGATVGGVVTLGATASDAHGVTAVEFLVNGAVVATDSTAPYSATWSSAGAAEGPTSLTARATDGYGNVATSAARSVTLDNTPPTVSLTAPLEGAIADAGGSVALTAAAADAVGVSRVMYYLDGATLVTTAYGAPYSASWWVGGAALGPHTLEARAVDLAGNTTASAPVTVQVTDLTPPTVSISSPSSNARVRGTITVTTSPSDARGVARVELYAGAALVGTALASPWSIAWDTTATTDGAVSLTARAYDGSGNSRASAAVPVTVDNTGPAVAVTAPAEGASVSGTVPLAVTASDAAGLAKVEYLVDGAVVHTSSWSPWSGSWNSAGAALGPHAIVARATDLAGNVASSAPVSVQLVDTKAPTVSLTAPASGARIGGASVTLAASASDAYGVARVEFYRSTLLLGTATSSPWQITWNAIGAFDGNNSFTAKAFDAAGNSATSGAVTAYVDNTRPVVSLTAPASGATIPGPVTVSATATDTGGMARVDFFAGATLIGSDTTSPYAFTWDPAGFPSGATTLTAVAHDLAGWSTTSAGASVTVGPDTTAPSVQPSNLYVNQRLRGAYVVTPTVSDDVGVVRVELYVDGALTGTSTAAPFSLTWDTTVLADGNHDVYLRAYDAAGNSGRSAWGIVVSVDNHAPSGVRITSPVDGEVVRGSVAVLAEAADEVGVTRVVFYDGAAAVYPEDTAAPYGKSWQSYQVGNGQHTLTAKAYDAIGNVTTSAPVVVTVLNPGNATWDATWRVPACLAVDVACDSSAPGRGAFVGPGPGPGEPHYSNTLGTCFDGPSGTYRSDESIEAVSVRTVDGFDLTEGKEVVVGVGYYPWSLGPTLDFIDVFHAPDASAPVWTLVGTAPSTVYGTASFRFTLPEGGAVQAFRASIRRGGSAVTCPGGYYDDRDDVVFAVSPGGPDVTPPRISITAPVEGQGVFGSARVEVWALDDHAVSRVDAYVDGVLVGSASAPPFAIAWDAAGLADGPHALWVVATDSAGLETASESLTVVATNGANAVYGAGGFTAPGCSAAQPMCSSGLLLDGRGPLGPEQNSPNTLGRSCLDATWGTYHGHSEVDAIRISTLDGSPLAAGKTARVSVTFWSNHGVSDETIDVYLTTTPASPSWTYLGTLRARRSGAQEVGSLDVVLPAAPLQAIRASYRNTTVPTACDQQIAYDPYSTAEADDLVFAVDP